MDANTQKGCMLGCLISAGLIAAGIATIILLMAFAIRGCTQMTAHTLDGGVETALNEKVPQDEKPFKKVWISGKGGASAVHVLKIRLRGVIADGVERNFFNPREDESAPAALRKIRAAIKDESIRGLYLDIDTPGGGVTMSDELYHAIALFRDSADDRFAFVHMGDLCCSGGYYVAVAADCIMARPTTLTGSIGVMMNAVNISELAGKIGLKDVTIASGENKDMLNPLKPVNPEHVKILEEPVRELHELFVAIVAKGRRLPKEVVRKLADGRVFSAAGALKNKLIDDVGHEGDALKRIKALAGRDVRIYAYRGQKDIMSIFGNSLLFESSGTFLRSLKSILSEEDAPRAEYRLR